MTLGGGYSALTALPSFRTIDVLPGDIQAHGRGEHTMTRPGRLNKVIELLEQGKPVFSCGTIPNGNYDEMLGEHGDPGGNQKNQIE